MTETLNRFEVDRVRGGFVSKASQYPQSQVWQDSAKVEYEIFKGAQYVKSPEELQAEYEPYEAMSQMVALYYDQEPIGEIRIVDYAPDVGFKTVNDIRAGKLTTDENGQQVLDDLDMNKVFEVGTIGLDPKFRSQPGDELHTITQLYGVIYSYGLDNDKPYVIASFDEEYLNRFSGLYGVALTRLGPPKDYMGSPTTPVLIDLNVMRDYFRSMNLGEFEEGLFAAGRGVKREDD